MKKKILYVVFGLYAALMLWLLFFQRLWFDGETVRDYYFVPFTTTVYFIRVIFTSQDPSAVTHAVKNILGNVVLFIPLGLFLPLLSEKFNKLWKVLAFTAAVMCLAESLQFLTALGTCDIDDVILNTLGALIGYLIYKAIKKTTV